MSRGSCHAVQVALTALKGGSFPFIDTLLFPSLAGRGAFQEGDEEARLSGLRSGFILFSLFWEGRPGSCFSLTVSRWCCWNTKISSVFGMAAARPPAPPALPVQLHNPAGLIGNSPGCRGTPEACLFFTLCPKPCDLSLLRAF